MAGRSLLATLLGSASAAPAVAAAPAPAAAAGNAGEGLELSAEDRAALNADITAIRNEERAAGAAEGFAASQARFCAVMNSDKGKANPSAAVKLLGQTKLSTLTAEEVIDLIEAPAAPAPTASADAGREAARARLEATPEVVLGNGPDAAAAAGDQNDGKIKAGSDEAVSIWSSAQKPNAITNGGMSAWGQAQQRAN